MAHHPKLAWSDRFLSYSRVAERAQRRRLLPVDLKTGLLGEHLVGGLARLLTTGGEQGQREEESDRDGRGVQGVLASYSA